MTECVDSFKEQQQVCQIATGFFAYLSEEIIVTVIMIYNLQV